jgi:predicted transcriptional regulator
MQSTTIKVPKKLHDRLAQMAKQKETTMAAVIEEALDIADKTIFWEQVEKTMTPEAVGKQAELYNQSFAELLEPDEDWSDLL